MWQPNDSRLSCPRCGTEFGVFTRKHHCRGCGALSCASCSDYWAPIPDHEAIEKPGLSLFADTNSGLRRCCYRCFHTSWCYLAVWEGFFSLKVEIFNCENEAKAYVADEASAIVMHGGTAKIAWMSNPNATGINAKLLERGRGKMRKLLGEDFYDKQSAAADPPRAPPLSNKFGRAFNGDNKNDYNNVHAPPSAAPAAAAASAVPVAAAAAAAANSGTATTAEFSYIAAMCLPNNEVRCRYLQPDMFQNKAALAATVASLAKEEWASPTCAAESIQLLDTDWVSALFVETAKFYMRHGAYQSVVLENLRNRQRFVYCEHVAGRADCSIVAGLGDVRQRLLDAAARGASAVAIAGTGEPVGHTIRDISVRVEMIDRAGVEALRLLHGQSRGVYVATTATASDVRVAESLWDVEKATNGEIRTTVQAWVWAMDAMDKQCIVRPFLAGAAAPVEAPAGVQASVAGRLRTLCAQGKNVPTVDNRNSSSGGGAAAAAAAASAPQPRPQNNSSDNNNNKSHHGGLAAPPPRPEDEAAAAAGASPAAAAAAPPPPPRSPAMPECMCCLDTFDTGAKKPLILPCCGMSICAGCSASLPAPRTCPQCREKLPEKLVPNRTLIAQLE